VVNQLTSTDNSFLKTLRIPEKTSYCLDAFTEPV